MKNETKFAASVVIAIALSTAVASWTARCRNAVNPANGASTCSTELPFASGTMLECGAEARSVVASMASPVASDHGVRVKLIGCANSDFSTYRVNWRDGQTAAADVSADGRAVLPLGDDEPALVDVIDPLGFTRRVEATKASDCAAAEWTIDVSSRWRVGTRFVSPHGEVVRVDELILSVPRFDSAPYVVVHRGALSAAALAQVVRLADGRVLGPDGEYRPVAADDRNVLEQRCFGVVDVFGCPPVQLSVLVGDSVLHTVPLSTTVSWADFVVEPQTVRASTGSVRGRVVRRETGEPIPNVRGVTATALPVPRALFTEPVDRDGAFQLDELVPGPTSLIVDVPQYRRVVRPVEVRAGEVVDVGAIELDTGAMIEGRIVDEEGRPVVARLWASSVHDNGEDRWQGHFPDASPDPSTGAFYVLHLPSEPVFVGIDDARFAVNPEAFDLSGGSMRQTVLVAHRGVKVSFSRSDARSSSSVIEVRTASGCLLRTLGCSRGEALSVRLLPGDYRLARPAQSASQPFHVPASADDIAIELIDL